MYWGVEGGVERGMGVWWEMWRTVLGCGVWGGGVTELGYGGRCGKMCKHVGERCGEVCGGMRKRVGKGLWV